jgi:hypothetical protein
LKTIKNALNALGGWPVCEKSWNEKSWTWQNAVKEFIKSGMTNGLLFKFKISVDERNASRRVLIVSNLLFKQFYLI